MSNFTPGNGNDSKKDSINTKGIQLYGATHERYPSTLVCAHWNAMATIKIHPALPEEKRTKSSVYNYDEYLNVVLSLEENVSLLKKIDESILPALAEGKNISVGIIKGQDSIVAVSVESGECVLSIFKDIDGETKKPGQQIHYAFNPLMIIENYNAEDGSFQTGTENGELYAFIKFLQEAAKAATAGSAHAERWHDRWFRKGNGQETSSYNKGNKGNVFTQGGNSSFNAGSTESASETYLENANQIDDFLRN